jgi:hypothetical protein
MRTRLPAHEQADDVLRVYPQAVASHETMAQGIPPAAWHPLVAVGQYDGGWSCSQIIILNYLYVVFQSNVTSLDHPSKPESPAIPNKLEPISKSEIRTKGL